MGKIDLSSETDTALIEATNVLESGGVVIFPTDTVYGIGALPKFSDALERIYAIKKRPQEMSLPLLLSDMTQVSDCSTFNGQELQTLAKVFWPGPLTLILPDVLEHMNELLTQDGTVAVRSPDHDFIRGLCAKVGPIAATSANIHGQPTPLRISEMPESFDSADLIIDGGECSYGTASTIIELGNGTPKVIREGPIPEADVLSALL